VLPPRTIVLECLPKPDDHQTANGNQEVFPSHLTTVYVPLIAKPPTDRSPRPPILEFRPSKEVEEGPLRERTANLGTA
jgi:hypothetical protein